MRMKWIPTALTVGLLAAAVTGGAVFASGGGHDENGQKAATGVDTGEAYELAARVAEIVGTDPQATADALARVDAELQDEYVDAFLQQATTRGHITAEQADAIRAQVRSGDYSGYDQLWKDINLEGARSLAECGVNAWAVEPEGITHKGFTPREYANRVGAILSVDGQQVADAVDRAFGETFLTDAWAAQDENGNDLDGQDPLAARVAEILGTDPRATADALARVNAELQEEYVDAFLRQATARGHVTAEQADAIRVQVRSGDYSDYDQLWEDIYLMECGGDVWLAEPEGTSHDEFTPLEYANRVGAILNVDGQQVADAIEQVISELYLTGSEIGDDGNAPEGQSRSRPYPPERSMANS